MTTEFNFDEFTMETEESMENAVKALKEELAGVRVGRANPLLLDKITVDYYGAPTAINQVANISVPEPRMLLITPWEKNMLGEIEKAIIKSDLGLNPNNDGKCIRLVFPELTEERRVQLSKSVNKSGEDAKIIVRNARRNAMESAKKAEKSSLMTEDDLKSVEKDIQDLTDKYSKAIDTLVAEKTKEIMAR